MIGGLLLSQRKVANLTIDPRFSFPFRKALPLENLDDVRLLLSPLPLDVRDNVSSSAQLPNARPKPSLASERVATKWFDKDVSSSSRSS